MGVGIFPIKAFVHGFVPQRECRTHTITLMLTIHYLSSWPNASPITPITFPYSLQSREYWRQFWRVAGRESGSPELPRKFPELPRKFPELLRKFFGDFPGVLSLWNLTAFLQRFPEVSQTSPEVPRFPGSSRDCPGGLPISLGSLAPSPDSQKLSLANSGH